DAVVHLPVLEEVTPGVDVRDSLAVVAHLVVVGRADIGDGVGGAAKEASGRYVGGSNLRLGGRGRHDDPAFPKPPCARDLLRRDQVGGAFGLLSDRSPLAPGLELGPPLLILRAQRRRVRRSDWRLRW